VVLDGQLRACMASPGPDRADEEVERRGTGPAHGGDPAGNRGAAGPGHLRNYVGVLRKMGQALTRSPWLAGDSYSLADIAMLPYVLRLDDMAQTWIWEESDEMRPISAWLEACRARPGYAGITRHLNASVVDMMKTHGAEDAGVVRNALL
jgi:glutathione S-transferase